MSAKGVNFSSSGNIRGRNDDARGIGGRTSDHFFFNGARRQPRRFVVPVKYDAPEFEHGRHTLAEIRQSRAHVEMIRRAAQVEAAAVAAMEETPQLTSRTFEGSPFKMCLERCYNVIQYGVHGRPARRAGIFRCRTVIFPGDNAPIIIRRMLPDLVSSPGRPSRAFRAASGSSALRLTEESTACH